MTREYTKDDVFSTECKVRNLEGSYWLIRKGGKNSRVLEKGSEGSGILVKTSDIYDTVKQDDMEVSESNTETPTESVTEDSSDGTSEEVHVVSVVGVDPSPESNE